MATLSLPPEPIQYVRRADPYTYPVRLSVRDEGRLLSSLAREAVEAWPNHSAFLADQAEGDDPTRRPLGYVTFPTEKVVRATFTYAGELPPLPVPELDD